MTGEMPVRPDLLAPNGYLHAASVVGLADTVSGYGTRANLPEGARGFTTIELKSNFLGTALEGVLDCEATMQHGGRTTQVWDAACSGPREREDDRALPLHADDPLPARMNASDRAALAPNDPVYFRHARTIGLVAIVAYVLTVVAANWAIDEFGTVSVGFGLTAPAGVYFAGLAFTLRDITHDTLGRWYVLGGIAAGSVISLVQSDNATIPGGVTSIARRAARRPSCCRRRSTFSSTRRCGSGTGSVRSSRRTSLG